MKTSLFKSLSVSVLAAAVTVACGKAVVDQKPEQAQIPQKPLAQIEQEALEEDIANIDEVREAKGKKKEQFLGRSQAQNQAFVQSRSKIATRQPAAPAVAYEMADMSAGFTHGLPHPYPAQVEPVDRENYAKIEHNATKLVVEDPVSTFSIDVDTGAYANVRRFLHQGSLPRHDAVRAEELINYFSYNYEAPQSLKQPFSVNTEIAPTPWNKDTHLLHIGIKGYEKSAEELPASNLVFLVDVSGSMNSPDKLGLLKSSLKMLTKQMRAEDKVAIAVYAGAAGMVLEPTPGNNSAKISAALDRLSAGGSTNGGAGIKLAYNLAEQSFIQGGVNRVIIATDGDFNVGTTNFEALKQLIEEKRKTGIALTTLGFGTGNYNDHLMEQLANAGNGNYAYIDTLNEARKVLVEEMGSTLLTIAKDVKIQIEFNPDVVAEYRLVGYENRMLKREDFNNDKVDAGDIGAGHTVTALYEVTLANSEQRRIEPLRYNKHQAIDVKKLNKELAFLRLRYKQPDEEKSCLIEQPLYTQSIQHHLKSTSDNYRFSAAVAGFSQLLRGGKYTDQYRYADVLKLARGARDDDPFGYRGEFIQLVGLADSLSEQSIN